MKKLLLFLSLILLSQVGFAQKGQQAIGFKIGGMVPTKDLYNQQNNLTPRILPTAGVYYDWNFSQQLGISTGIFYRKETLKINTGSDICICLPGNSWNYSRLESHYSYLELPVNLALNLNTNENTAWKSYFLVGYTYSRLILIKAKLAGKTIYPEPADYGIKKNYNYLNAGFEIRYNLNDKYTLGFGPNARFLLSESQDVGYFGFSFKIGRIL